MKLLPLSSAELELCTENQIDLLKGSQNILHFFRIRNISCHAIELFVAPQV